jgi:hypothetical protein
MDHTAPTESPTCAGFDVQPVPRDPDGGGQALNGLIDLLLRGSKAHQMIVQIPLRADDPGSNIVVDEGDEKSVKVYTGQLFIADIID